MNMFQNTLEDHAATVAELAISYPSAVSVFTKYNIDFCCGGHRSLEEACARAGLNAEPIKAEIMKAMPVGTNAALRFDRWSSALLVDFIIQNHHAYVKKAIPEIQFLLDKVCDAHGEDSVHLLQVRDDFNDLADELLSHMHKEEFVLFPAIKRLASQEFGNVPLSLTIQHPIQAMEDDHTVAGDLIKSIRGLSSNYIPPDYACPTYRVTYQKLKEFDDDLMMHIHLENNILFTRVKTSGTVPNP